MSKMTYRVKVRVTGYQTYEIDAESTADAEELYAFGVLVYDDVDHDYIDSVVEIDTADPGRPTTNTPHQRGMCGLNAGPCLECEESRDDE